MKKIKFVLSILAFLLLLNTRVSALECKYSDGKLTAVYDINESSSKASDAIINGTLKSSDETNIKNKKQGIENWNKIFKPANISAKGQDYYNNHKACPPYSIFVDRTGQFDFAVFSESHLSEFEKYGKEKQGYAIMKLVSSKKADPPAAKATGTSCMSYNKKSLCENNERFECIWNETKYGNYCNTDKLIYVSCGDAFDIPYEIPGILSFIVNLLKIGTPIILVIVGMITLIKALAASKEDEIKKAKDSLIRKLIAAAMVFLVIAIVQFVIIKVADETEVSNVSNCLDCFLNNDCENTAYYKTNISGTYYCKPLNGGNSYVCKGNK